MMFTHRGPRPGWRNWSDDKLFNRTVSNAKLDVFLLSHSVRGPYGNKNMSVFCETVSRQEHWCLHMETYDN